MKTFPSRKARDRERVAHGFESGFEGLAAGSGFESNEGGAKIGFGHGKSLFFSCYLVCIWLHDLIENLVATTTRLLVIIY
ncbi:hypothetical protein EJB05_48346 [Eragrostis curvula]|uniref:Uncharacterized protein n=1 Tax=Eragrostis curvula TaxID=38414 RepID=A0A5J9T1M6_9POAL|nr:hypothetical protein EJB05_48346 [Eragrostis curvula]